jgi:uncharacterized protein
MRFRPPFNVFFICLLVLITAVACDVGDDDDSSSADDPDDDDGQDDDTELNDDTNEDDDLFDDDTDDDEDHTGPWEDAVEMVPMPDGVPLRTKIFLPEPDEENGVPVVMCRTPYRDLQSDAEYEKRAQVFVDLGMAFVLQDCRGRGESEGEFEPYVNEVADGAATSEWITEQYWSNDDIGTFGASYDAYAAVAAAVDNPRIKVVVAEEPTDGESGLGEHGGTVSKSRLDWLYTLKYDEWMPWDLIVEATNMLDVAGADLAIIGESDPYWRRFVEKPDPSDGRWSENVLDNELQQVCAPMLILYSMEFQWSDPIDIWRSVKDNACARRGADQRIIVGPDPHGYHTFTLPYFETTANQLMLDYMQTFLKNEEVGLAQVPAAQFRSADETDYHAADTWPPQSVDLVLHLDRSGDYGNLREGNAQIQTPDSITVNPEVLDPCSDDYPTETYYSDSDFFSEQKYIAGTPTVEIYISSSTFDADLFVDLVEIPVFGENRLIGTSEMRVRYRDGDDVWLNPDEIYHLSMKMFPVAFTIRANSRLALDVRPAHCGFFENPHTAQPLIAQTHWESTTLTIYHDDEHPSQITIPFL